MRPFRLLAAAAVLAATSLFGVPAVAAPAATPAPWTVQPADNDYGPDRQNYLYTVQPGEQVDDGLLVVNQGTTPLQLAVYAADGFTNDAGELDLRRQNEKSTSVGTWVHPSAGTLSIKPGQSASVPFTVTVPKDAPAGDHIGGIVTSLMQGGVEQRMGVRIQLRVGGELKPELTIQDVQVHPSLVGGNATVTYTVHNTGNATLSARATASLAAPFGALRASSADAGVNSPALLPGDKWNATVAVKGVAAVVPLSADVTVVPLVTDAAGSTSSLTPIDADAHARTVPLILIIAVVLLAIGGLIVLRRRGRRTAKSATA